MAASFVTAPDRHGGTLFRQTPQTPPLLLYPHAG
jgi:hypothetical protein